MFKKRLILVFLLAVVVFSAGCITDTYEPEGTYKVSSLKQTYNDLTWDYSVGDDGLDEDFIVLVLGDGKYHFTTEASDGSVIVSTGEWDGETSFEFWIDDVGTFFVELSKNKCKITHYLLDFESVFTLKKV